MVRNGCAWWIYGLYQGKTKTVYQIKLPEMEVTDKSL